MGCCCGKSDNEKENERKLLEAEKEEAEKKKKAQEQQQQDRGPLVAANRPEGTHRDRIIALFAKHEKENLPLIDPWMEKLSGPRRAEYFIKEFCLKRDCTEPKSKQEALKECLTKHFAELEQKKENASGRSASASTTTSHQGNNNNNNNNAKDNSKNDNNAAADPNKPPSAAVLKKVDEMMKNFAKIKPGQEGKFFEEIFGPGDKKRMEEQQSDGDLIPSSSFAAGEALKRDAQEILDRIAREEEEEAKKKKLMSNNTKKKREKRQCTCDQDLKDRIMAMMIEHCPERLDALVEEEHYYDSESGAELLYSLIEEFGEEPESKHAAITACYRRLLEEHDPHRLKSLPTMVAAAMAASSLSVKQKLKRNANTNNHHEGEEEEDDEVEINGVQQAVAKVLKTYGVAKPTKTVSEQQQLSIVPKSSHQNNSSSSAPAFIIPSHSSTSTYYSSSDPEAFANSNNINAGSSSFLLSASSRRFPPQEMRQHHFVPPYMTTMDGEVQRQFIALPVPNHHEIKSNYEKARLLVSGLDENNANLNKNGNNNNFVNHKKSAVEELLEDLMTMEQQHNPKNSKQNDKENNNNNIEEKIELLISNKNSNKTFNDGKKSSSSTSSDDSDKDDQGQTKTDADEQQPRLKRKNVFNPEAETVRNRKNIVLHGDLINPAGPPLHHRRKSGDSEDGHDENVSRRKLNPFSSSVNAIAPSNNKTTKNEVAVVTQSPVVVEATTVENVSSVTPQKQHYYNADEIDPDL